MRIHPWLSADITSLLSYLIHYMDTRTGSSIPFFKAQTVVIRGKKYLGMIIIWLHLVCSFLQKILARISIDGPVLMTAVVKTTNGGVN